MTHCKLLLAVWLAWFSFQAQAGASNAAITALHPSHIPTLAASCAACHGSHGNSVSITPMLAGLNKQYFVTEMLAFKHGTKASTVMHRHAKGLSDEEISLLADYFTRQPRRMPPKLIPQALGKAHE